MYTKIFCINYLISKNPSHIVAILLLFTLLLPLGKILVYLYKKRTFGHRHIHRFRKREEMKIWIERSIVTSAEELNSRGTRFLEYAGKESADWLLLRPLSLACG